jgi:transposase
MLQLRSQNEKCETYDSLKGNKYTILKAENKLTEKQQEKLDRIREASPLIAIMHSLKEEFSNLFDTSEDLGTGMLGLLDWLKKAKPSNSRLFANIKKQIFELLSFFINFEDDLDLQHNTHLPNLGAIAAIINKNPISKT